LIGWSGDVAARVSPTSFPNVHVTSTTILPVLVSADDHQVTPDGVLDRIASWCAARQSRRYGPPWGESSHSVPPGGTEPGLPDRRGGYPWAAARP
jgi:hypothetical protein